MAEILKGASLLRHEGSGNFKEVSADELSGKVVAFYFSAHWCPPCRAFTPVLKDFYEEVVDEKSLPLEIVFVSFDRTEADLKSYMQETHGNWLVVKFGSETIQNLSTKYGVSGIPALTVVKSSGDAVVTNGRGEVQTNRFVVIVLAVVVLLFMLSQKPVFLANRIVRVALGLLHTSGLQMADQPSLFTKIIRREIPSDILYEDDLCIAIHDINPKAPKHFLIIPKEQLKGLSSATDQHTQLLGHLMTTVRKVAEKENLSAGYRVVLNDGREGGQEVPHLHIHLLGGRQMDWPPG